jgi:hypothetical protein
VSTQSVYSVHKASSNRLDRQVAQYSLAAAVAGVSMLALTAPAAGEVVVTKKTIHIPLVSGDLTNPVKISMANDGADDFSFTLRGSATAVGRFLLVRGLATGQSETYNQFVAGGSFYTKALPLARGAEIGPSASFGFSGLVEETASSQGRVYSRGSWPGNLKNKYLGVRFQLNGETHYGWIRLTVTTNTELKRASLEATITGYAYETVADKPIKAGTAATAARDEEPAARVPAAEALHSQNHAGPSLGMLARGADALPAWRRE